MAEPHDLVLERMLAAPRDLVWKAWTDPEHLRQWWAPRPYETPDCEMDLRPGGIFYTRMTGPDGFEEASAGCFLEVVPRERIVWTSALGPGYRPADLPAPGEGCESLAFTAIVTFEDSGDGRTRYRAVAMHRNQQDRDRHEQMGFDEGWGTVAGQLEQVARGLAETV